MPVSRVNFETYAPDSDSGNPAILTDSTPDAATALALPSGTSKSVTLGTYNTYPTVRGYKNLVTPLPMFGAPDATKPILGAFMANLIDGSSKFFAGTSDKLWEGTLTPGSATGTWNDVSRTSGGAYSVTVGDRWNFAQLGDVALAVGGDELQAWDLSGGTDFATVADAPTAKLIEVANNFVILGGLTQTSYDESWVWVGGFGQYAYWTTGDQNLSENFALADTPGPITALKALGNDVFAFKQRATHLLSFSGAGWTNALVSTQAGAVSQGAVVDIGDSVVTLGSDSFYQYSPGGSAATLKCPLQDKLFGEGGDINREKLGWVQGRFDSSRNVVFWHYPSKNNTETALFCDRWVAWSVDTDRWAIGENDVSSVIYPDFDQNTGVSYSNFGTVTAFNGGSAVTWQSNMTSPGAAAGTLTYNDGAIAGISGLVSGYCSSSSTGAPASVEVFSPRNNATSYNDALVQTGDFGDGIVYKFVRRIRPRFVAPSARNIVGSSTVPRTNVTLSVYSRNELDFPYDLAYSSQITLDGSSPHWFTFRANARYFKFSFLFSGGEEIAGFEIDYDEAGLR